jgi:hypothetical protein
MSINLKKYDEHVFILDIDVKRYEHFTYGNSCVGVKTKTLRYVEECIKAKPTDQIDGLKQDSLTSWADYCDVVAIDAYNLDDVEGAEADAVHDDDEDYWTIDVRLIARFKMAVPAGTSREKAKEMFLDELNLILEDPIADSLEEFACDFSANVIDETI